MESVTVRKPHSPRFISLSPADVATLFGDETLEAKYPISRGRFVARQRVALVGPKGRIDGVPVVGPVADATAVQFSVGDEDKLGLDGRGLLVVGERGEVKLS